MVTLGLPSLRTSFLIHLTVTYILLGIAIVTQFISYPLFEHVAESDFSDYHQVYLIRTVIIVTPLMLAEALTGLHLVIKIGDYRLHRLLRSGLILILTIWIVSFLFDLPNQFSLQHNFNSSAITNIIIFNWFRIILWAIRGVIVAKMIKYFYSYDTIYEYEELV